MTPLLRFCLLIAAGLILIGFALATDGLAGLALALAGLAALYVAGRTLIKDGSR